MQVPSQPSVLGTNGIQPDDKGIRIDYVQPTSDAERASVRAFGRFNTVAILSVQFVLHLVGHLLCFRCTADADKRDGSLGVALAYSRGECADLRRMHDRQISRAGLTSEMDRLALLSPTHGESVPTCVARHRGLAAARRVARSCHPVRGGLLFRMLVADGPWILAHTTGAADGR